ncbi:hypothetical protein SPAN111604_10075 [Sphingomonas antarctica]
MTTNNSNFRNTLTAIVGAVLMSTTCLAVAVSPARAATPTAASVPANS